MSVITMPDLADQTLSAAALLAMLTTDDLPVCQWLVLAEAGLEGFVDGERNDDVMYALQQYADKLGTGVQHFEKDMYVVTGHLYRAPVRVLGKVRT
jgi:hypothetical protein